MRFSGVEAEAEAEHEQDVECQLVGGLKHA